MSTPEVIWEALDEAFAALEEGDVEVAKAKLAAAETAPEVPEVHYMAGQIAIAEDDLGAAKAAFARAIERDPRYADAHYAAAQVARETGAEAEARAAELRVWDLDLEADEEMSAEDTQEILRCIEGEAERVLAELPDPFRTALADVPVLVEARPPREIVETGFDPRALGMFQGPDHASRTSVDAPPAPTQIFLYWTNILDTVEDDEQLVEEIEITLLHEIAHYFGLDEAQVAELGLA